MDDRAARRARCIYCDHAYESERPSQWGRLHHLSNCRPLPRDTKPGLFHEAMAVLEQERQARQAAEAARDRYRQALAAILTVDRPYVLWERVQHMEAIARQALAEEQ